MNIGIVTTWWDCGAGFVSRQIMDILASEHNVFIYARGERYEIGNSFWDLDNVHWGTRVFWPGSGRIDQIDFENWLFNNSIDSLIFNEQRWWQPILWAKKLGVICGAYIDYYTADDVLNFAVYDVLICNTERHFDVFKWHPGATFVKWGTNINLYRPQHNEKKDAPFTFFHSAGRAPFRKGTDILLKAFNSIKDNMDARLVIHTQVPLEFSTSDKVEIVERTVGPPGLYHLGDVYVYPSRLDGLGLTVCEALSCGLPVITTDNKPMSEFIIPEYNGLLINVDRTYSRNDGYYWPITEPDVENLATKMSDIYEKREYIDLWKKNARLYVQQERDWSKNAKLIERIISESKFRKLFPAEIKGLLKYDQRGLLGKLDVIYKDILFRRLIEKLFEIYRKRRQPHLYRDIQ